MYQRHFLPSYKNYSDQELTALIQSDNEKAFNELISRYWKRSHINAYARVRSHEVAQEIVQDVFMSLWNRRHGEKITHISAYIFTSIRNKCLNYIESKIIEDKYWQYYRDFLPDAKVSHEDAMDYDSLLQALDGGLATLPEKTIRVFKLSRMEGRSIREIASLMNLSEKAIEYHLTRSLKFLRGHLKDFIAITLLGGLFFF